MCYFSKLNQLTVNVCVVLGQSIFYLYIHMLQLHKLVSEAVWIIVFYSFEMAKILQTEKKKSFYYY